MYELNIIRYTHIHVIRYLTKNISLNGKTFNENACISTIADKVEQIHGQYQKKLLKRSNN